MAGKPAVPTEPSADERLAAESDERLMACRAQKAEVEADLREAYFATRPRLSRQILSTSKPESPPKDADQLASAIGAEVTEDFTTEVINAFMPPHVNWCRSEAGEGVDDELWKRVKPQVEKNDAAVFRAIRASNFDSELPKSLNPDGALGTHAIWIDDQWAHEPILCQHIPLRELEINVGPYGGVGDRFVVRWVRWRNVPALFPGVELPEKAARMVGEKPDEWAECRWGYWRDWSDQSDTIWQYVAQVDGEIVGQSRYKGEGSCPLIVGRFSPDSLFAFGNGPTLEALPYLRIHHKLAEATQDHAAFALRPPIAFPEDGVMNFEGGIEDSKAYPKRPGSKGEIENIYPPGVSPDAGLFTLEMIEKTIRRKHFADYPEQPGKTPPSATQWLDEMVKSQRRIGTPGQIYWRECPAEVFLRFKYLLEKRGVIQPLTNDKRAISTRPQNPATRAQENQELQTSAQLLGMLKSLMPMTSQVIVDEIATAINMKEKSGDKLIVFRNKAVAEQFITGILQGLGNAGGGQGAAPDQGQQP